MVNPPAIMTRTLFSGRQRMLAYLGGAAVLLVVALQHQAQDSLMLRGSVEAAEGAGEGGALSVSL